MPAVWIPKRLVEYSLINVASENTERFVQRCETQYENRIFQAAGAVLESGRKIVMLTGPSASGKTTTAVNLAAALTEQGFRRLPSWQDALERYIKELEE